MENTTPENSKPQPLALVAQVTAEITKNKPGVQTTEFYVIGIALIAVFILTALGKLPTGWAGTAAILVPAGYQYLRNNRKDDRESSLLQLVDTISTAAPNLSLYQNAGASEPKAADVSGSSPASSPAPVAPPSSGPVSGNVVSAIIAAFVIAGLALSGCGTTSGVAVANALESPANQMIIQAGVNAGILSLESSLGGKVPASMEAPLTTAASTAATGLVTGLVFAGAEALRTKQSTDVSASPAALTTALVNQAGLPQSNAQTIAQSVSSLSAQGIPPDVANEAVASALDAAAAAKAPTGK